MRAWSATGARHHRLGVLTPIGLTMEFTSDEKTRAIQGLIDELLHHIAHDDEPLFVGDEATLLDVSSVSPEELMRRCTEYYRAPVSLEDLRKPLWQLVPELDRRRNTSISAR